MTKIQFSSQRYSVTIPMSLLKAKGWDKGTEVIWQLDNKGKLYLSKQY